ncbi:phospholipid methyltransferase-domain-containing protein [Phlyctochytrium arcticum]|nr:phospholipid methyltransferase-domain-containing protein [Phlyctochytrium arcticum]
MMHTLFARDARKTLPEFITLGAMAIEISLYLFTSTPRWVFLGLFLFWRFMYNVGLGWLLSIQSKDRALIRWALRHGLGPKPTKPRTWWAQFLVEQITAKMSTTSVAYNYEEMPIEFNTWILYRGVVDIILVNDFTCYILFALSYFQAPADGHNWIDVLRYAGGVAMLFFNLWVKTDAHRVVKDFAWYWGDFFFLVDASLTFDGVFEMAPHPMYSVGYIGFYGTALIAQSYWVLFISLAAHASQMAFLHWVENPHIDKTYNPPTSSTGVKADRDLLGQYFSRDMVGLGNIDWCRSSDLHTVAFILYSVVAAIMIGPIDSTAKFWFYVGQTLVWRFIHTYILGAVLYGQSTSRFWTRHFVKHGETPRAAFEHWKVVYNTTQVMTYVSFVITAIRLCNFPETISEGTFLLRATLGVLFIVLHIWIAVSIFEVIGTSGWFYGDFFIDELRSRSGPVYTGLYRYLNNPLLYTFSCWGIALICQSPALYAITVFGQISNWLCLRLVEQPHMRRLYGSQIRRRAGVERVLKTKVSELEKNAKGAVEKIIKDLDLGDILSRLKRAKRQGEIELLKEEGSDAWVSGSAHWSATPPTSDSDNESAEDDTTEGKLGLRQRRSRKAGAIRSVVSDQNKKDTAKNLLQLVERVVDELDELVVLAKPRVRAMVSETTLKFAQMAKRDTEHSFSSIPIHLYEIDLVDAHGAPVTQVGLGKSISITFQAVGEFITSRDWIGIYPVIANPNENITTTQSYGRWLYVTGHSKTEWDTHGELDMERGSDLVKAQDGKHVVGSTTVTVTPMPVNNSQFPGGLRLVNGTLTFRGETLPWKTGIYEARYHYAGSYDVAARSLPFEIVASKYDWSASDADEETSVVPILLEVVKDSLGSSLDTFNETSDIMESVPMKNCADTASYLKYQEDIAKRITHIVKQVFGIDFSWRVIACVGNVRGLARQIVSAKKILRPTIPGSPEIDSKPHDE